MVTTHSIIEQNVHIATLNDRLGAIAGILAVPDRAWGVVLFAHGGGSALEYHRDRCLANSLHDVGLATLRINLFSPAEEHAALRTAKHRVDIGLMTDRLNVATDWINRSFAKHDFTVGFIGIGAGAAAALTAASKRSDVAAVVSCNGLPILAGKALAEVSAATLLIVGELDQAVIEWNVAAYARLQNSFRRQLAIVPNATQPQEASEALKEVSHLTTTWFVRYLGAALATHVQMDPMRRCTLNSHPRHETN